LCLELAPTPEIYTPSLHDALPILVRDDLSLITGSHVGRAATKGDPMALSIVQRAGKIVGLGIVNLLHLFNPQIIVVGGGVSNLRSEEHTSELQSRENLVCRLLLEK